MKIAPKVDRINELLIRKGLNRKTFAQKAQIGLATASQICRGVRNPNAVTAKKITDALDVEFDEIFEIEIKELVRK